MARFRRAWSRRSRRRCAPSATAARLRLSTSAGSPRAALRRLAFAGALAALAVVVSYLEQIPWLELQSLVVFAAGFLLGARLGALVGALAMAAYSAVNPYGFAHPLVFAAQVVGRAAIGAAGGVVALTGLPRRRALRAAVLAGWALGASLAYDLLTNVAGGIVYGQLVPSLALGIPFALGHAASNVVLFVAVGGPLLAALEPRRQLLAWAGAVATAVALAGSPPAASAQSAATPPAVERPAPGDTVSVPDTSASEPPAPSPSLPLARGRALAIERADWFRRAPTGVGDAASFLAAAPRFYDDFAALEPLSFAGMPPTLTPGFGDGVPLSARGCPWEEPARIADGGRAGLDWSTVFPLPEPGDPSALEPRGPDSPSDGGARGSWRSLAASAGKRAWSAVWAGTGDFDFSSQGFRLGLTGSRDRARGQVSWSAWTKKADLLGELGRRGAHGLELSARGSAGPFRGWLDHHVTRAALSDRDQSQFERRGSERSRARFEWTPGATGRFAGLSLSRVEDRVDAEGPIVATLGQVARDLSAAGWLGTTRDGWRLGAAGGWTRQRLRQDRDDQHYAPRPLDVGWGGGFLSGRLASGDLAAALVVERAAGRTTWLPSASWEGGGAGSIGLFAGAGRVSAPTLSQLEATELPADRIRIHEPRGWAGQAGLSFLVGGNESRAWHVDGAPGVAVPGRFQARLGVCVWTLDDALFSSFGFFAREVLEGSATFSGFDGVAGFLEASWTPKRWTDLGISGYGAGRKVPAAVDLAVPDARALVWIGPRVRLFSGSLDIALRGELDVIGPRAARDESFPAIVRPGARAVVGLGSAWIVVRGTDLDDARHPLPGRRFDGERLQSPGRVLRVYGEWRFLD